MKHTTFFGDGKYTFALTDDMITELERLAETGIGAIYMRAVNKQFTLDDLIQTIRLGLVGGGTPPKQAVQLVDTYARNQPFDEIFVLALDILDARWNGTAENEEGSNA